MLYAVQHGIFFITLGQRLLHTSARLTRKEVIMTKKREIYRCSICGNTVEVLNEGGGTLVCCGKPMEHLEGNMTDASLEKHVPVVERIEGGYRVTVGSTPHPMTAEHYIQWIELLTASGIMRQELSPADAPVAVFTTNEEATGAREYCNLHGLWKK